MQENLQCSNVGLSREQQSRKASIGAMQEDLQCCNVGRPPMLQCGKTSNAFVGRPPMLQCGKTSNAAMREDLQCCNVGRPPMLQCGKTSSAAFFLLVDLRVSMDISDGDAGVAPEFPERGNVGETELNALHQDDMATAVEEKEECQNMK
ncbi:hypothetical protein scyTo_0002273 [Scyliorhinus torazame]|uniref:Uncharacterized protein n=1 Tax=Scyliorhinus torazame TaxID=75743 RepID=A0A401PIM6_SCYTO|nr:hypothetical protein [Scyliorhinus torazame]